MNKSNIKIIFVDIDQTILWHHNGHHDFDKKSIKALKKAQKNGVNVIISTARPYDSVDKQGLFKYLKPDGLVCANGAVDIYHDKVIRCDHFTKTQVKKVLSALQEFNLVAEISTEKERFFTGEFNPYIEGYMKSFTETYTEIRKSFEKENIVAMLLFAPEKYDRKFFKLIGDEFFGVRFTEFGNDIKTHDVNKQDGVKYMLKYLKIKKEDSMSIGDSLNDKGMLLATNIGVALGNADDDLKSCAKFVSKDISKHGVYFALKHYKII